MEMQTLAANIDARPSIRAFDGRDHLVVPVVMARSDVEMNGARIPVSEMMPQSWNGVPVTVGHPVEDDSYISANSPATLEQWAVGRIFNAEVTAKGQLRAEAWIDTGRIDDELAEGLQSQSAQIDVSTGYFSDVEDGEYRDIKPDHLALLPNESGACSWEDGCGVRANKRGIRMRVNEALDTLKGALGMQTNCRCEPQTAADKLEAQGLTANEGGYREIMESIQSQLDQMDREGAIHFLTDVFEDSFVYEVRGAEGPRYFRRGWQKNEDGTVEMTGEPEAVTRNVSYEPISTNTPQPGQVETHSREEAETMTRESHQDEGQAPANEAEVLTHEDRAALEHARKVYVEHRNSLVSRITANSDMGKEALEQMDTATLETIANGLKPTPDYSGRVVPAPHTHAESDEDVIQAMTPPSTAEVIANRRNQEAH